MRRVKDEDGNPWHEEERRIKELNTGVKGAHCSMPFQCEVCWVRNLENRDPTPRDKALVSTVRRATLDSMSGKARNTILGHRRRTLELIRNAERINKTPSLQPRGPLPLGDPVGMGLAVDIIQKSLVAVGRNEPVVQAETLRQLRSTFSKNWASSPRGITEAASFGKGAGRVRPTACPSQSEWYQDFWRGLEARMGFKSRANHPLSMAAMVEAIKYVKSDALAAETPAGANYLWKFGAYLTVCTAGSLRGYEGFYLDLSGLRKYIGKGRSGSIPPRLSKNYVLTEEECARLPHVALPLLGKFKGQVTIDHHIINVANETSSGLKPRWWLEKLVDVADEEGRIGGPVFASPQGNLISSLDFDSTFRYYLEQVQEKTELIPGEEDVQVMYGISRTPRKTATTRAKRAGYDDKIDEMNRWRKIESAANRRVRLTLQMLYSGAILMMPTTWRVSHAL